MTAKHRNNEWLGFIRTERPRLKAALPLPCVQRPCYRGGVVMPEDLFDVAHLQGYEHHPPSTQTTGAAHRYCNRRAGQAMSTEKRNQTKQRDERFLGW